MPARATLLQPAERALTERIAALSHCNPFLDERIACEREVLGADYRPTAVAWNLWPSLEADDPNVAAIEARARALADDLCARLGARALRATDDELRLYEDLVLFVLYYRYSRAFGDLIGTATTTDSAKPARAPFYAEFRRDAERLLAPAGRALPALQELGHVFACFYQIRRAFHHVFYFLVGASRPTAALRAAVWQSIFSHDLRRYRQSLHAQMADFATLITGPSGTGKELVARAIGFARYIPFREREREFSDDFFGSFQELNLAALPPTLIESELFGHKRGAFTGATADRPGWFETCPPLGTVFLDEIGDLDLQVQVKLLRVLQNRSFQRLGESRARRFHGKVIAATHRNLGARIEDGAFREDLYYRLCGDLIEVPSLHDRLRDDPQEIDYLLRFLAKRVVAGGDADGVAAEVGQWIDQHLGRDYAWPGNVRELEQCLRNVLLRRTYRPWSAARRGDDADELGAACRQGALTADELLRRYATLVWRAEGGNLEATARRLDLDRRTVKRYVGPPRGR